MERKPRKATCTHHFVKHGKDRYGVQRWRCNKCEKTKIGEIDRPLGSMRLSTEDAAFALSLLLEGMSIRACGRISKIKSGTLCSLVLTAGKRCEQFLHARVKDVPAKRIEMDEMWSIIHCRGRTAMESGFGPEVGNTWTWFAIDSESKLILAYAVGRRDKVTCNTFLKRLARASIGPTTICSDGLSLYATHVVQCLGTRAVHEPVFKANFCERFNLTVRMHLKRFSRCSNGFSKSLAHHEAMLAIFVAWYNFGRINTGIIVDGPAVTPAMAAGLSSRVWTIKDALRERKVKHGTKKKVNRVCADCNYQGRADRRCPKCSGPLVPLNPKEELCESTPA